MAKEITKIIKLQIAAGAATHPFGRGLVQASALKPEAPEAHNLLGILHECRNEHDASYREYRAALKADRHYEPAKNNMQRYYERFTFGRSDVPIDTGDR